jgi:UDP-GlcNAc:undecaprenyl-phosphate/decaprenyl-phosphate GlcNAc-1-phosphate transferase
MSAPRKFLAQFLAALVVVIGGNLRLYNLDGLLGISSFPEPIAIILTVLAIVFIINAYNLIDGVDGLAGSLALLASLCFGVWFLINGHIGEAILAASLAGALLGFLYYNISPARIFMGDTGSLLIGLTLAVMAFRLIDLNAASKVFAFESPTLLAIALLIIPIFDALRIIMVRLLRGSSPFLPDRNHIHHKLMDIGFSAKKICRFLLCANTLIIAFTVLINRSEIHLYYFSVFAIAALLIPSALIITKLHSGVKSLIRKKVVANQLQSVPGDLAQKRKAVMKTFYKPGLQLKAESPTEDNKAG